MDPMQDLYHLSKGRPRRISSYDVSGGNHDWMDIPGGETRVIADIAGCGIIRHIWCTHWTGDAVGKDDPLALRKLLLRIWWDGEDTPSVQAPLGDFFGMPFARHQNFSSAAFSMGPEDGRAMNCWWPMPFRTGARIELQSLGDGATHFYYYIDYEQLEELPGLETAYFHTQFRREPDTNGWAPRKPGLLDREKAHAPGEPDWMPAAWVKTNTDGNDNYVILEAAGRGRYVGCNMGVDIFTPQANAWYGEGDDMIFIDGETWPPTLHGTGTEDYFCTAHCPTEVFCTPYHGLTLYSGSREDPVNRFAGQNAMYRLHIADPIAFEHSIRVTIEHGHANKLSGDWCSTAYWYQMEPHAAMLPLPGLAGLLPKADTQRVAQKST